MRFAHLPVAGGIYAQHPKLIDHWYVIMSIEHEEEKRREARSNRNGAGGPMLGAKAPRSGMGRRR